MPTIKSFIHLASCKFITRLRSTPSTRVRDPLSSIKFVRQHPRPFSSTHHPSTTSTPNHTRTILTTLPALGLLAFAYKHFNPEFGHPLALDTPSSNNFEFVDAQDAQYRSPLRPLSADEASDYLRWEESSRCLGAPSDVLRYDAVRVPSNQPSEDVVFTAFGSSGDPSVVDEDLRWIAWGVFDGHA